jgi:hypothetical protein
LDEWGETIARTYPTIKPDKMFHGVIGQHTIHDAQAVSVKFEQNLSRGSNMNLYSKLSCRL